jgi:hypothetical protein
MEKFDRALAEIDRYNMQDPVTCIYEGVSYPQEYFLSLKMYQWVQKLYPEAGEELLLAARSHHLGRWQIPRDRYPEGRTGYLTWRSDLASFHADKAAEIMRQAGYSTKHIDRVVQLILKKNRKGDPEVQLFENAACLVFLECQYEDFLGKHDDEKVEDILRKTLRKMDGNGRDIALSLPYSEEGAPILRQAIQKLHEQGL